MRSTIALLVLLAAVALSGCGVASTKNNDSTKDFTGAQKAVAATVEDLQTAAKDHKGTTICADLITAELRDKISASNCPKIVKDAIRDTDDVDLTVKSVTVTGDKAVAQVKEKTGDKASKTQTINFENAAGRWRISELPQS
jgi:hypothetical protein